MIQQTLAREIWWSLAISVRLTPRAGPGAGLSIDIEWSSSDALTFQLGAPHAGAHSFNDKVALELCDGADDHDHGSAQRAAGVAVLPEADELDVEVGQLVQNLEDIGVPG
jgi:hypothetical protein